MSSRDLGRRFISSKLLLLISLIILAFFSTNLVKVIINRRDLAKDVKSLQGEINSLEGKNQELTGLIEYFKSLDFVEKEARTKLNLKKPGEQIIIVADEKTGTNAAAILPEVQPAFINPAAKPLTNPERWWDYFINRVLEH